MTVRIVHKNSEAEDKHPSAGQLAKGEIAVNLHSAGAFLSVRDTAGNVQQVGGVKVSANAPSNPVLGTFWLDSDNNTLFIYDGSAWRGVTGGGGGGGSAISLAEGDAIDISQAGSTYTIGVKPGPGINVSNNKVEVDLVADPNTVGLKMVGAGDAAKLAAEIASSSRLGSVKVDGTTITAANDGEISAVVPAPLTYKGNLNPTTRDSGADAIITNGSPGDAWTVSWGGADTTGTLDENPDWVRAIRDASSGDTATIGDLLVINSGTDGSAGGGENEWTLVKTGTVDNSATISVGDGQTNAFPPDSPAQGDVWYNTDDARTYVYIRDSGGQDEWVDISPQGNQMLWEEASDIIEPVDSDHELKIDTLGTNSTDGTRLVMSTATGVLKGNIAGDGLEIQNGVLKVRDSGANRVDLQFVTDIGNSTTNAMTCGSTPNTGAVGATIDPNGFLAATVASGGRVFVGRQSGATTETSQIFSDGGVILDGPDPNDQIELRRGTVWAWQGVEGGTRTTGLKWDGTADFGAAAYLNTNGTRANSQATLISYTTDGSTATAGLYADGKLLLGNTTANPNITLNANGSALYKGPVTVEDDGGFVSRVTATTHYPFRVKLNGNDKFSIGGDGRVYIGGDGRTNANTTILEDGTIHCGVTNPATLVSRIDLHADTGHAEFEGKITFTGTTKGIQFETDDTDTDITSQTLDDYEEGNWSPSVTGATLSLAVGRYTKVGRLVTAFFDCSASATTGAAGDLIRISGLPFPFADSRTQAGSFKTCNGIDVSDFMIMTRADNTIIKFMRVTTDSNATDLKFQDLANSNFFHLAGSITYHAS